MSRRLASIAITLVYLCLNACTTSEKSPSPSPSLSSPSESVEEAQPDCLNVQEGDRHVEVTATDLLLAESGTPRALNLNDGDDVVCEKLEIIRGAKKPSVFIRFRTRQVGTSIGISDTKIAIASITYATWILKPLVTERRFRSRDGSEVDTRAEYSWKNEGATAQPILTITDSRKHSQKVIKP